MAALAYTLGKREINYYFSVRSAKALALGAVLLLTACHAASRRYRGEGAAAGSGGHAGKGTGQGDGSRPGVGQPRAAPPGLAAGWSRPSWSGTGPVGVMGLCSKMLGPRLCVCGAGDRAASSMLRPPICRLIAFTWQLRSLKC